MLNKIDQNIIHIFSLIKTQLNFGEYKIFSFILPYFFYLIEKSDKIVFLKLPNFHKLLRDIISVYISNKEFILYSLRLYIYISILFYVFTFFIITFILATESSKLIFLVEFTLIVYRFWTFPIKKIRFLIKYLFIIPYGILKFIFNIGKWFLHVFSQIFKVYDNPINECMERKDEEFNDLGKSPEYGRTSSLSSTEWELNCMNKKITQTYTLMSYANKFKSAGTKAGGYLDHDLGKPSEPFKKTYADFNRDWKNINNKYWCPSNYDRTLWNNSRK